jgi:hypothetical protein
LAQIIFIVLSSRPNEGRFAIVTNAGWDAMDATASSREVDRRAVSRERYRRADERRMLRTVKSCGPDAPTLASSFAEVHPPNRV